jgi:hypothetical protein
MQFKPFYSLISSVMSLATVASAVVAQTAPASSVRSSVQNPCPGIYYEEPHNSVRVVPQGCPPNVATRLLSEQGRLPSSTMLPQVQLAQPAPQQQAALTAIAPQAGRVNVRMRNDMNTEVTYQVIGQTGQRTLAGGQEVNLQNLPTPVTMTFVRPDGGLVRVTPISGAEGGVLAIGLNEASGLNTSQTTLRIQGNGGVFAY